MGWEIWGLLGCWVSSDCLCHTTLCRVSSICLHVSYEKPEWQGDEILPDTSRVPGGDQVKLWSRVLAPEPLLPSTMLPLKYNPMWQPHTTLISLNSVQFSHSVVSDSLRPHELQHARPPWPAPTPRVYSNSCPLSQWCHPTISSSVVPFSSHPQSFPASGSFQMSQLFASGSQSIKVSASTSVLPMNIQDWSPLVWTGWISLQSKGLSRVFSNTTAQKHQFFGSQLSF